MKPDAPTHVPYQPLLHPNLAQPPIDPMDAYLFDLNGFLRLDGALSAAEVAACNAAIDAIPALAPGEWYGRVHREQVEPSRGIALQQIYETGPAFERWIDHPRWLPLVREFIGGWETFDGYYGDVFIDENFVSLRGPGEAIGLHAGGHKPTKRTQYRFHNGRFMCMEVNILVALNDIGPGDGATVIIPASHKANLKHPQFDKHGIEDGASADCVVGGVEVHLKAGDALLFSDMLCHGSAKRINPGQRRLAVFRYSPAFTYFRFGYRPSPELLARLNPIARKIVMPHQEWERTPNRLPA